MAILTGSNLSLGYEGKVIIDKINFEINKGDYLCIVGENGVGKSTLMKTMLGLIQPINGKIIYGEGLNKNQIGYLPQQTVVQRDFPASVEEIVMSGCQGRKGLHPFYSKEDKAIVKENMERLDIMNLSKKCYRKLSGGQQQRVLLARALCATKELLILDEPVSGLDPKVMAELYTLIEKLNKEGTTIIMISHDITVALNYASHVLHIDRHTFFGKKDEYLKSDECKKFMMIQEMEEHN